MSVVQLHPTAGSKYIPAIGSKESAQAKDSKKQYLHQFRPGNSQGALLGHEKSKSDLNSICRKKQEFSRIQKDVSRDVTADILDQN